MTWCPQAIVRVVIETAGRVQAGYSGDCLPPGWFDKSPDKSYRQQIDDMLAVIKLAEKTFSEEFASPTEFFPAWLIAYERVHSRAAEWQLPPLLASFGISLLERAIIDAMARAAGASFFQLVRSGALAVVPHEIHPELPEAWPLHAGLAEQPLGEVFVRHTIGLGDPLTDADLADDQRLGDGLPHTLEEHLQQNKVRFVKIKVANRADEDLQRLRAIAALMERYRGDDYAVTVDGNEQYRSADQFLSLVESIESSPELARLWRNTVLVEQPLERRVALDARHAAGIRALGERKPVIIDESDGHLRSYREAIDAGYRGVSSKSCKGVVKSMLNAGLTRFFNEQHSDRRLLMSAEDLCTVGIVPVQSDLCLVASLGIEHVERNGHHYHRGLSYLPESQQRAALEAHPDLYAENRGLVALAIRDGRLHIGSLQCVGFGFAVEPDWQAMTPADAWQPPSDVSG